MATSRSPSTGTALPSAQASSARVITPGMTGLSGTPEASARAATGRAIRSASRYAAAEVVTPASATVEADLDGERRRPRRVEDR